MTEPTLPADLVRVRFWYCVTHHDVAEDPKGPCRKGESWVQCLLYRLGYQPENYELNDGTGR